MTRAAGALAVPLVVALVGCGTHEARLTITPALSASDQPLRIVATGLPPHATATIRVSSTDAAHARWAGFARLRTSRRGTFEIPMRVIDDLQPSAESLASYYSWPTSSASRFVVRVSAGGAPVTGTFSRRGLEQPVTERQLVLGREGIAGGYFAPAAPGRYPALLLFGGSEGGLASYALGLARQIASHGVAVLDLAYWNYPGLPDALERIPLEYFARGLDWLRRRADVDASRVDVEGISRGSEAALLLGAYYPRLVHGVVASVPSNVAYGCFGGGCSGLVPAWTYRGRGIAPFSPIPVERIRGPIFAICGTRDLVWPSCRQARAIIARRRAHGVRYSDTLVAARGAGHFVGAIVPYQIAPTDLNYTQRAQDEAGAEELWPELITFLGGKR